MQVVVSNLLIQYQLAGKGKLIVLLHGWGDTSHGLIGLQRALQKSFEVLTIDLPGFGGSQSPPTAWDLTDYATLVSRFLDKLHAKPYAMLGHSNGGAILIRGIGQNLLTPERLILVSSAGIRGQHSYKNRSIQAVVKTGKLLSKPLPMTMKRSLRRRTYRAVGSDFLVAQHLEETFKKIIADDVRRDAAKIIIPTLLLYGTEDRDTPIEYGKQIQHEITNSRLIIIEGAGHFLHIDSPDKVTQAIKDFLS